MKHLKRTLTLLLACLLLAQTALPGFALEEELNEAEAVAEDLAALETEPEDDTADGSEQSQIAALQDAAALQDDEAQDAAAQQDAEAQDAARQDGEAETAEPELPDAEPAQEPETEELLCEETVEESAVQKAAAAGPAVEDSAADPDGESVEPERLYNGLEGDFDDPQFLKLLNEGFFDEDDGPVRALANIRHPSAFNGYKITKGVDISKWNNHTNWAKVKRNGIDFAIIRCGNRFVGDGHLGKDEMFDTNMRGALNAGLEVGVYIYSQAISVKEAIEEARFALNLCKGYHFTLPIVMDYEYYAPGQGRLARANLSKAQRTRICQAFCTTIRQAGYPAMVYANRNLLTEDMYGEQIVDAGHEIWLAEWNPTPKYTGTFTYWQYTDAGYTAGFDHKVDMNFRYQLPDSSITRLSYTNGGVLVQWSKSAPAEGYRVYRKEEGGDWDLLYTAPNGTTLRWLDDSAVLDTRYHYSVQPFDGKINGTFDSEGKSILYQKTVVLKKLSKSGTALRLEWVLNPDYDHYQVFRRRGEGNWTAIATVEGNVSQFVDKSKLASGHYWNYSVAGIHDGHRDGYDELGLGCFYLTDPVLTGTDAKATGIQVKWKATPGAKTYRIYRKKAGEKWTQVGTSETTSWLDTKAYSNMVYLYTVQAVAADKTISGYNADGVKGMWLITPKISTVWSMREGTQVEVTWNKVGGAQNYRVYRRTGKSGGWTLLDTVTDTSYIDTHVTKNADYYYTVRSASTRLGRTILSGFQSGTAVNWLSVPQLTSAKPALTGVLVQWKKVSGANAYEVYRKEKGSGWKKIAATGNVTRYVDTKPPKGVQCAYTVRAADADKNLSGYDRQGISTIFLAAPVLKAPVKKDTGNLIRWYRITGAQYYRIYRRAPGTTGWKQIGISASYQYLDKTAGTSPWEYTVRASARVNTATVTGIYDTKGVSVS